MTGPKFGLALLLLLTACATAPATPAVAPVAVQDDYSIQIERRANALIAADPDIAPAGLEVSVLSVDESASGLFYKVQLRMPQRRGHDGEDYVIYGQCQASDIDRCVYQIIDGGRMLKK